MLQGLQKKQNLILLPKPLSLKVPSKEGIFSLMRKFILFFVLSLFFISFVGLLINSWQKLNEYNKSKVNISKQNKVVDVVDDKQSIYIDYSKEVYEKALNEKTVILMFFTANWCEECNKMDELINESLANLTREGVVGIKIHILDSETTTETTALSKKYSVNKEGSVVILDKNGAISYKQTGNIEKEILTQKLMEVISK